jgi:hypothetical protein
MIVLNIWPSMGDILAVWNGLAPYVFVLVAVILALGGTVFVRRWLRNSARDRRRPADPSPKRTMIVANAARLPVLEGQVLQPGDLVELRIGDGFAGGAKWVRAELVCQHKMWLLRLPDKDVVRAVGQLARWPGRPGRSPDLAPVGRKEQERQQMLLFCRQLCDGSKDPDKCQTSCPLFGEKQSGGW